ncbi:MAG: TRAP transporter small permease [Oscillospiraceae bacterium]
MRRFLFWLDKNFEAVIMAVTVILMFLVLMLQTILRYVFNAALQWPEEFSRYVFVWYVFLGMAYCVRHRTHLIVDFLEAFIPKIKKFYVVIGDLSLLAFALLMSYAGINKLQDLWNSKQLSPAMGFPIFYCYLALEVGFVLCVIRSFQNLFMMIWHVFRGTASGEAADGEPVGH